MFIKVKTLKGWRSKVIFLRQQLVIKAYKLQKKYLRLNSLGLNNLGLKQIQSNEKKPYI